MEPGRADGVQRGAARGVEASSEAGAAAGDAGVGAVEAARTGAADVEAGPATGAGAGAGVSRPAGAAVVETDARAAARSIEEEATRHVHARLEAGQGASSVRAAAAGPCGQGAAKAAELMQTRALETSRNQPQKFYEFHNHIKSCSSRTQVQKLLENAVTERTRLIENTVATVISETNSREDYDNLVAGFLFYINNFTLPTPVNAPRKGDDVHLPRGQRPTTATAVPQPRQPPPPRTTTATAVGQPRQPPPPTTTAPTPLSPSPIPPPVVIVRPGAQPLPPPRQPYPDNLMPAPPSPPHEADVDIDLTLRLRPPAAPIDLTLRLRPPAPNDPEDPP